MHTNLIIIAPLKQHDCYASDNHMSIKRYDVAIFLFCYLLENRAILQLPSFCLHHSLSSLLSSTASSSPYTALRSQCASFFFSFCFIFFFSSFFFRLFFFFCPFFITSSLSSTPLPCIQYCMIVSEAQLLLCYL